MPNNSTGDYVVINVSSPNTPGLRGLQEKGKLESLLKACVKGIKDHNGKKEPPLLFIKIAPDLTGAELKDVASVIVNSGVDGVIVSNTTNSRPDTLLSGNKEETGGLSGMPLRELSTSVIREIYGLTGGSIPIIGVGGVSNAEDAYEKILAGAVAVQLYSSLTYKGLGVVSDIKAGLKDLLHSNGYGHVSEAVGKTSKK
jgi:dihydroorotate dehydrogenase